MPTSTIVIYTKPSKTVRFYRLNDTIKAYWKETYIDTGLVTMDTNVSGDSMTIMVTYLNQEAFDAVQNDSILIANRAIRAQYNIDNGIQESVEVVQ